MNGNARAAVFGLQRGLSNAISAQILNAANTTAALLIRTNGTGGGIDAQAPSGSVIKATMTGGGSTFRAVEGVVSAPVGGQASVLGQSRGAGSLGIGVSGIHDATGWGVHGRATAPGYAGYFSGNVSVLGTLSKSGGSFKIDHPLDPSNKYLSHSFVESPDMMNVYNGTAILDASGGAIIVMPEWFEALNRDFRYQLTAIGAPAPMLHVARKVENGRFAIGGGSAGLEVSWQVTGIRQDPWAEANRIPIESDKTGRERGAFLHPELYGEPESKGMDFALQPGLYESIYGDD